MSGDVMTCGRCGHDLRIVCPEHGTEFVPDRRMEPRPVVVGSLVRVKPPRLKRTGPVQRGEVIAKPGTLTEGILLALAAHGTQPMTAHQVAGIVGRDAKLVGIYLAQLARQGRIARVGRGEYGP